MVAEEGDLGAGRWVWGAVGGLGGVGETVGRQQLFRKCPCGQ